MLSPRVISVLKELLLIILKNVALYGRMFSWIVGYINDTTQKSGDHPFVGVLDIFGFEDFKVRGRNV